MESKLVISPEQFIEKCKSLARAKNLYVDVKDGQIRLAWTDNGSNKVEYIDRIEAVRLGIPYELLVDVVEEHGGTIDIDGRYPVTNEIIRKLRNVGLRK
jgi:hypothetical protein